MKMHLFWISIFCFLFEFSNGNICPNGKHCDGVCCPLFAFRDFYVCCKNGCGFPFNVGCNLTQEKPKLGADFIMEADIFSPLSEQNEENFVIDRDISSSEVDPEDEYSIEESSEETTEIQKGYIKDILKKILTTYPHKEVLKNNLKKIPTTGLQMGYLKDILRKILNADTQMGVSKNNYKKTLDKNPQMGFLKDVLKKILTTNPKREMDI